MTDKTEFTPITTREQYQERLEADLKERIARAEKKAVEPYSDYDALKAKAAKYDEGVNAAKSAEDKAAEQIAEMRKQIEGLTGKLAESESSATRARIQAKHGISDEDAALFLTATDADALENQAKTLSERIGASKKGAPYVPQQTGPTDPPVNEDAALARQIFGGEG